MTKPEYAQSMLAELCMDLAMPRDDREMLLRHLVRNAKVGVSRDGGKVTLVFDADVVEAMVLERKNKS